MIPIFVNNRNSVDLKSYLSRRASARSVDSYEKEKNASSALTRMPYTGCNNDQQQQPARPVSNFGFVARAAPKPTAAEPVSVDSSSFFYSGGKSPRKTLHFTSGDSCSSHSDLIDKARNPSFCRAVEMNKFGREPPASSYHYDDNDEASSPSSESKSSFIYSNGAPKDRPFAANAAASLLSKYSNHSSTTAGKHDEDSTTAELPVLLTTTANSSLPYMESDISSSTASICTSPNGLQHGSGGPVMTSSKSPSPTGHSTSTSSFAFDHSPSAKFGAADFAPASMFVNSLTADSNHSSPTSTTTTTLPSSTFNFNRLSGFETTSIGCLNLDSKVDTIYSLASILNIRNLEQNSHILLNLSKCKESCSTMRKSNCVGVLVQIIYDEWHELYEWIEWFKTLESQADKSDKSEPKSPASSDSRISNILSIRLSARKRASQALHNIISNNSSSATSPFRSSKSRSGGEASGVDGSGKELRMLKQITTVREYNEKLYEYYLKRIQETPMQSTSCQKGSLTANLDRDNVRNYLFNLETLGVLNDSIEELMKLSFDQEQRQTLVELGGLSAAIELVEIWWNFIYDHLDRPGSASNLINTCDQFNANDHDYFLSKLTCETLIILINLSICSQTSFNLKTAVFSRRFLLRSFGNCMRRGLERVHSCVVQRKKSSSKRSSSSEIGYRTLDDDLIQANACLLRNISWKLTSKIDSAFIVKLRDSGFAELLARCMLVYSSGAKPVDEVTLKAVLSGLLNLSMHSMENKEAICRVDGALAYLVRLLRYKSSSDSTSTAAAASSEAKSPRPVVKNNEEFIVDASCGILRSLANYCCMHEAARAELRAAGLYESLLKSCLASSSINVVSNACAILWSMSNGCAHDQQLLWSLGAESSLKALSNSTHNVISMASIGALKNLYAADCEKDFFFYSDEAASSPSSISSQLSASSSSGGGGVGGSSGHQQNASSAHMTFSSDNSLNLSNSSSNSSSGAALLPSSPASSVLPGRSRKQAIESSNEFMKKVNASSISNRLSQICDLNELQKTSNEKSDKLIVASCSSSSNWSSNSENSSSVFSTSSSSSSSSSLLDSSFSDDSNVNTDDLASSISSEIDSESEDKRRGPPHQHHRRRIKPSSIMVGPSARLEAKKKHRGSSKTHTYYINEPSNSDDFSDNEKRRRRSSTEPATTPRKEPSPPTASVEPKPSILAKKSSIKLPNRAAAADDSCSTSNENGSVRLAPKSPKHVTFSGQDIIVFEPKPEEHMSEEAAAAALDDAADHDDSSADDISSFYFTSEFLEPACSIRSSSGADKKSPANEIEIIDLDTYFAPEPSEIYQRSRVTMDRPNSSSSRSSSLSNGGGGETSIVHLRTFSSTFKPSGGYSNNLSTFKAPQPPSLPPPPPVASFPSPKLSPVKQSSPNRIIITEPQTGVVNVSPPQSIILKELDEESPKLQRSLRFIKPVSSVLGTPSKIARPSSVSASSCDSPSRSSSIPAPSFKSKADDEASKMASSPQPSIASSTTSNLLVSEPFQSGTKLTDSSENPSNSSLSQLLEPAKQLISKIDSQIEHASNNNNSKIFIQQMTLNKSFDAPQPIVQQFKIESPTKQVVKTPVETSQTTPTEPKKALNLESLKKPSRLFRFKPKKPASEKSENSNMASPPPPPPPPIQSAIPAPSQLTMPSPVAQPRTQSKISSPMVSKIAAPEQQTLMKTTLNQNLLKLNDQRARSPAGSALPTKLQTPISKSPSNTRLNKSASKTKLNAAHSMSGSNSKLNLNAKAREYLEKSKQQQAAVQAPSQSSGMAKPSTGIPSATAAGPKLIYSSSISAASKSETSGLQKPQKIIGLVRPLLPERTTSIQETTSPDAGQQSPIIPTPPPRPNSRIQATSLLKKSPFIIEDQQLRQNGAALSQLPLSTASMAKNAALASGGGQIHSTGSFKLNSATAAATAANSSRIPMKAAFGINKSNTFNAKSTSQK